MLGPTSILRVNIDNSLIKLIRNNLIVIHSWDDNVLGLNPNPQKIYFIWDGSKSNQNDYWNVSKFDQIGFIQVLFG